MSTSDLLGGPLAQAIGLALLHALWQGAIVAAIAAAALALMSRRTAAARYAVACGALALVFGLTVFTAVRSYSPPQETSPPAIEVAAPAADDAVLIPASVAPQSFDDSWTVALTTVRSHIPQILLAWLAGVLVLTVRLAASWTRARALASRGAVAADEGWQRIAAKLSAALGLRRRVRLVIAGGLDVPSVIGWLRPAILLPIASFSGLTTEQLEMVLAHELAHIRRHDFLVNAMQSVVETLLFYHPAVWWLSRQIRIERENCCDDLAVSVCGDAIQYARALAQLEELRGAPAVAVAASGASLIGRIRRLVGAQSDRSLFSNGWTAAAATMSFVLLLAVTAAPMLAERKPQQPPKPPGTQIDVNAPKAPAPPAKPADEADDENATDEPDVEMPDVNVEVPEVNVDVPDVDVSVMPAPVVAPVPQVHVRVPRIHVTVPNVAPMAAAAAMAGITPFPPMAPMPPMAAVVGVTPMADMDDDEPSSPAPPGRLSVDDLIALRVQGITPEYIQKMRSAGLGDVPLREIIGMRVQGVTPEYVQGMRSAGFSDLTARDIIGMRVQGVTPEYVSGLRSAGVPIKTARDVISLKVQNVTPEFVRSLAAAGYDHLTVRDLLRLAVSGVNADFIREMSKYKK